MKILSFICGLLLLAICSKAQVDQVRLISMEKTAGANRMFLLYQDTNFRLLAPEHAIRDVLKKFKPEDKLPKAFEELNSNNSTDYFEVSKNRGLGKESQLLIHELLERGDCLVEKKPDSVKVKGVTAMTYTDGQITGIKYYVGEQVLYNYIDPKK